MPLFSKDGSISSKFWEVLQSSKPLGFPLVTSCRSVFFCPEVFALHSEGKTFKTRRSLQQREGVKNAGFPFILVVCVQPASSRYTIQVLHNWKVRLHAGSKGSNVEHDADLSKSNLLVRRELLCGSV